MKTEKRWWVVTDAWMPNAFFYEREFDGPELTREGLIRNTSWSRCVTLSVFNGLTGLDLEPGTAGWVTLTAEEG